MTNFHLQLLLFNLVILYIPTNFHFACEVMSYVKCYWVLLALFIRNIFNIKNQLSQAGEMAQWLRAPDCSSKGPEFNSQQPHRGSQLSLMGSDAVFWCVRRQQQNSYT